MLNQNRYGEINSAWESLKKEFLYSLNAKDDPSDAQLQLELLLQHRNKLKPLQPQGVEMRTLQCLVEQRRGLVNDRVRLTNQLTYALKQYFPQVLAWFKDKDTLVFCDFLSRWSTLKQAQQARKTTLEVLFHAHHVRYPKVIEARVSGHPAHQ